MKGQNISKNLKIAAGQFVKEKEYWINKLSGEIEKGYFPYDDFKISTPGEYPKDVTGFKITGELCVRLMEITNGSYPKIYMVLAAGVAALLAKYTGNDDMIVGTSIERQDVRESLINTILPLRIVLSGNMTFKELLIEIRKIINEAIENQNYPIETLIKEGEGLFDVVVLLENIQEKKYVEHLQTSMTFSFRAADNVVEGELEYDISKYEKESIERIIQHFLRLLHIALFDVNMKIIDIELHSEEDKEELARFNYTRSEYPHQKTIHELFALQVKKTPDHIALMGGDGVPLMSYKQLNQRADRWVKFLVNQGVTSNMIIGIEIERSMELICALLAVLKIGCAYLPLDINYPPERKSYMLEDSGAPLLITRKDLAEDLIWKGKIVYIEDLQGDGDGVENHVLQDIRVHPSDPAYVIYTSGSTGRPKGVVVEHRALVNYVWWAAKMYVKNETVGFPFHTSTAFDLTVTSIYTPLLTGNAIYIYGGNKEFSVERIFEENKVEAVKLTPVHLKLIADHVGKGKFSKIKRFIVGGEKLGTQLAQKIYDNFNKNIEIYNEYGPTEAAVGCMIYKFNPQKDKGASVPIGVPVDNAQIYLLDKYMKNVPHGGIGELYIAGDGLARGYLNKPELTAEKFITNPFKPGEKMFKTGDTARRLRGGDIEFLGRADQQVKIKGYRIETAEIEFYLLKHEHIDHAVVLAKNDDTGYNYLVAYILPSRETSQTALVENRKGSVIELTELRDFLSRYLPGFMIPSYFVPMEKLPLTPNGKIDRDALPAPNQNVLDTGTPYRPPTNDVEKIMAGIWQEVMGVDRVGLDDGYFNLGGDSIKAIQISARLQKFNLKVDIGDLFQYPTIAQLSSQVRPMKEVANQGVIEGHVPLSPIQQWFFHLDLAEVDYFNQSVMLYRPETFDSKIVEKVFTRLVMHHDALRMVYIMEPGQIKQVNRGIRNKLIDMDIYEITGEPYEKIIEEKSNQIQSSMDLTTGPLVKLGLFKTIAGDYLLITIHHLVIDTVSWRILFEDFTSLYQQLENGVGEENLEIPLKTTPYKEWAEKLYEYSSSEELIKELEYWQNLEETGLFHLFTDNGKKKGKLENNEQLSFQLSEEYTKKLLQQVNRAYNTEINDILLTALSLAISDWIEIEKIPISLEGHGRENIIAGIDISRTVGWFTSIYPVILDTKGKDEISTVIKNTKEMIRHIPCKGIGYGILKYLTNEKHKQGIEFRLHPEISFNYLGQVDEDINNKCFRMAEISSGNSIGLNAERIYTIYVTGLVLRGKLIISVSYETRACDETETRAFVNFYDKRLRQIIDHCTTREKTELTVSDFDTSLNEEEAELVFDTLGEMTLNG
jgi:amino acid adenylation domain-containing protein/non-ribosomal peptide synthase protein (TIGR01720 family)